MVKRDSTMETLVAPSREAREQWIRAIHSVQNAASRHHAAQLLDELQADLACVRSPQGCANFEK